MQARLQFFLSVAIQLQPFLQTFQTDVPLGPFLHSKRKALQNDADALSAAADDFSEQAEKLQQLTLLAKANGMRRAAREKGDQLKELNQLIDNKLLELENCP